MPRSILWERYLSTWTHFCRYWKYYCSKKLEVNSCNLSCTEEWICLLCKSILVQPHPFQNDLSYSDLESLQYAVWRYMGSTEACFSLRRIKHELASNFKTGLNCNLILVIWTGRIVWSVSDLLCLELKPVDGECRTSVISH